MTAGANETGKSECFSTWILLLLNADLTTLK